jgi:hypothetical protein
MLCDQHPERHADSHHHLTGFLLLLYSPVTKSCPDAALRDAVDCLLPSMNE